MSSKMLLPILQTIEAFGPTTVEPPLMSAIPVVAVPSMSVAVLSAIYSEPLAIEYMTLPPTDARLPDIAEGPLITALVEPEPK